MVAEILARIKIRLSAKGLKAAEACQLAGLGGDVIRDIERSLAGKKASRHGVSTRTLEKLAPILGTTATWLASGSGSEEFASPTPHAPLAATFQAKTLPNDVPVMGTAAGSLGEGSFQMSGEPIDYVKRPPAMATVRDVYAIYVEGDSMAPEHEAGALRFVHPHRPPSIGDTVIIHIKSGDHLPERYYIKRLTKRTPDFLVCSQHNPAATIHFKRDTVIAVHKVLTMNDLFGI